MRKERQFSIQNEWPSTIERNVLKDGGAELLGNFHEIAFQKVGGSDARVGMHHQ